LLNINEVELLRSYRAIARPGAYFGEFPADFRTLIVNRAKPVLIEVDAVASISLLQNEELAVGSIALDDALFFKPSRDLFLRFRSFVFRSKS
jgi:hypothetical protein